MPRLASVVLLLLTSLMLLAVSPSVHAQGDDDFTTVTYEAPDGAFTFDYAADWVLTTDDTLGFNFTNSNFIQYKLDRGFDKLFLNETLISMNFIPHPIAEEYLGIAGSNSAERLNSLAESLDPELEITGRDVVDEDIHRILFQKGDSFVGMLVFWQISDDMSGVGMMMTAPGNFEEADMGAREIFSSVEFHLTYDEIVQQSRERGS